FKDAVNGSKTTDEVAQALQNAKNKDKENADAQALQTAKDEANKEIDALPNLTAEEKQGFKDAVNGSKTTDEVAQAL
ncbi:GA module-containing protein, partial [Carnobacterium divergens]